MPAPQCPKLRSLMEAHYLAESVFADTRKQLRAKIGVSSKEEYSRLDAAADTAWQALNKARKGLHEHLLQHGCGDRGETVSKSGSIKSS